MTRRKQPAPPSASPAAAPPESSGVGDARSMAIALTDIGYHVTPLEHRSKAATQRDWQNMIVTPDLVDSYFPDGRPMGIGLLLGTEVADGIFVGAFDIDLDDDTLALRVRMAVGPGAVRKKGRKGQTIIFAAHSSFPSKQWKRKVDGRSMIAVELLSARHQTVLPPSIHPDTGEPYRWIGKALTEVPPTSLPVVSKWGLDEVQCAAQDPDSPVFALNDMTWNGPGGGGTVDDSVLRATAALVARQWPDDAIIARVERAVKIALLDNPNAARWDDRLFAQRLVSMIDDARKKGFAEGRQPKRQDRRIVIVDAMIERLGGTERLWRDVTLLRGYRDGHWPALELDELEHQAINLDTSWMEASDSEAVVRTVFKRQVARQTSRAAPRICLRNGMLDVHTGELLDWNAADLLTAQLPFDYDARECSPVYDAFIQGLFAFDNDGNERSPEEIRRHVYCYEEFLGLTLVDDLAFQKALILKGPPATGKSTALGIFRMLQDPRAVSTASLHKMHEERYLTSMVGKLVNLSGEIPADSFIEEETFKKIVGGDGVSVRKLFEEVKDDVRMTVRIVAGMNEMFRVRDTSGAVERRLLILGTRHSLYRDDIELHSSITKGSVDPRLPQRLLAERGGILNRAVEGLRRLLERQRFDPPLDHHRMREMFTEESNHLVGWVQDRTHEGQRMQQPEYKLPGDLFPSPTADLYYDYAEWAKINGHRQMSNVTWGKRLTQMGYPGRVTSLLNRAVRIRDLHLISNGVQKGKY